MAPCALCSRNLPLQEWRCSSTRTGYQQGAALLACLLLVSATFVSAATGNSAKQPLEVQQGPCDESPQQRGLVDPQQLSTTTLVKAGRQWHRDVVTRHFKGPVLGYVTPWNPAGYDAAVRWRARFSHISPVWYQLTADAAGALVLVGGHDVDAGWLGRLRTPPGVDCEGDASNQTCSTDPEAAAAAAASGARVPRIVPRVVVELPDMDKVVLLLTKPGPVLERLVAEVGQHSYDGLVLELWGALSAGLERNAGLADAFRSFVVQLAANLKDAGDKELILAVPPLVPAPGRSGALPEQLLRLLPHLGGASLMTYDYTGGGGGPGPNAPLTWMEDNVVAAAKWAGDSWPPLAPKLWLGLNMYGYQYQRDASGRRNMLAVNGPQLLQALAQRRPTLRWDQELQEASFRYKVGDIKHQVWYPTPASMAARIHLASKLGVGLSIWELGQGLEAFFDLL